MQEPIRIRKANLWRPSLEEIANALTKGLSKSYTNVSVTVEDCPDLRDWGCSREGMSGNARILDVGGEAYAHNRQYRNIEFSIPEIARSCGTPEAGIFSAGMACPSSIDGHCGEMIASFGLPWQNLSKVARVGQDKKCVVEAYTASIHSGLSNLYLCDGRPGKVIRVDVAVRTGKEISLTQIMRKSLINNMNVKGVQQIALGGGFKITAGRIRSHVMPDYNCIGFEYFDEIRNEAFRNFLQFYEMGPNLLCFSVLWTGDPTGNALYLRPSGEHTHFYAIDDKQEAGHYHGDVTPEEVSYTGYFYPAETVFRINDLESRQ